MEQKYQQQRKRSGRVAGEWCAVAECRKTSANRFFGAPLPLGSRAGSLHFSAPRSRPAEDPERKGEMERGGAISRRPEDWFLFTREA